MKKFLFLLAAMLATSMGLLAQGNSWQTATLINSGATKTGTLDSNNTEDWYKITVTQEGTVQFIATPSGNLTFSSSSNFNGLKNNSLYTRVWFTAQSSGSTTYTCKATDVGIGTYYIKIARSGGSGSYTLKYTFTPCAQSNDPEPNNDYEHSSVLQSGTTVQGRMGYRTSDDITDTEDWYKIIVPEEGHVEFSVTPTESLTISTNSNFNGLKNNSLYTRAWFAAQSSGSTTMICRATDVGKGTYYVRIYRNNGSGGYTLKYTFTPCAQSNDPEPNDDYEHSSVLQSGTTVQGRMGYRTSDDITDTNDWYKIIVPEEGHVEFSVTPTESLTISTNSNFNGLKNNSLYTRAWFAAQSSGSTTMICRATDVGKGTYYVRIYRNNGSGGYTLKYTFTPCALSNDAEPNDDYEQAGWLKSGWTAQGRLGYRTSDDVTDNYDWYRIKVTKTGPVEIIVTPTESLTISTSSNINVIKNNGLSTVGWFSAQSSGSTTLTYKTNELAEGTYYVRIYRSSGSGGYRLTYNGPTLTGDVDGDHRVNIEDLVILIDYLLGKHDSSFMEADADVDGDGIININDVADLIDLLLNN